MFLDFLPVYMFLIPLVGGFLVFLIKKKVFLRNFILLSCSILLLLLLFLSFFYQDVVSHNTEIIFLGISQKWNLSFICFTPINQLIISIIIFLWFPNLVYSLVYMRKENDCSFFFGMFYLALASSIFIVFSSNLLSLFIGYEFLTLATLPLVGFYFKDYTVNNIKIYFLFLFGSSVFFLFPTMFLTDIFVGSVSFYDNFFSDVSYPVLIDNYFYVPFLIGLFLFGFAKSGVMPVHKWLPAAMVAPTPVSAFLHAVAVVNIGVFAFLKVVILTTKKVGFLYPLGLFILLFIVFVSVFVSGIISFFQDNLKKRLAYSTISQIGYLLFTALLFLDVNIQKSPMAVSLLSLSFFAQIIGHSCAKISLFFCAGVIYETFNSLELEHIKGWGRELPVIFSCFLVASLSLIGVPLLIGFWFKFYLASIIPFLEMKVAVIVILLLLTGSLTSSFYLLPILYSGIQRTQKRVDFCEKGKVISMYNCIIAPVAFLCFFLSLFFHKIFFLVGEIF